MKKNIDKAISRVLNIKIIEETSHVSEIDAFLLGEYFRRLAVMLYEINFNGIKLPIFHVEDVIGECLPNTYNNKLLNINNIIDDKEWNVYIKTYLKEYIKWNGCIDERYKIALRYSNLFNPLIKFFENGHSIFFRNGEVIFGEYSTGRFDMNLQRSRKPFYFGDE